VDVIDLNTGELEGSRHLVEKVKVLGSEPGGCGRSNDLVKALGDAEGLI
jgi:hypothetical protein